MIGPVVLDADAVRRLRLAGQRLDGDRPASAVADVVAQVVGIQAQDQMAAGLSIRPRGPGLTLADVEAAIRDRSLVLTWSLRGTRHYHASADVRWLVGLVGPAFAVPGRRAQQLGIAGGVGDRAVAVLRRALAAGGALTRPEVKELLAPHGVDASGQAAVHILHRAALEGVLCVVPEPGGEERYVLLDDWVPPGPPLGPGDAAAALARRYVHAYGPVGPADLAAWSGLPRGLVKAAWASIGPELVAVATPGGTAWLARPQAERAGELGDRPAPVRMVGGFDTLLLGLADRSLHLDEADAASVNAGGGLVKPVVFDDGRVVARWALRRRGGRHRIEVMPFGAWLPDVEPEIADIARFLAVDRAALPVTIGP